MRRELRLAILTYDRFPDLYVEDRRLIPAFAAHHVDVEPAIWSDPTIDWRRYDAVLVRSCWNYHEHYESFRALLDTLDTLGVPVFNASSVIRWNTDKRYLLHLERSGVPVLPTAVLDEAAPDDVAALAAARGWERVVVKPVVSANGSATAQATFPLQARPRDSLAVALGRGPALVQPFAPEIIETGEYSCVFIDGAFSHAVLKRPMHGEFRVQVDYGGSVEPYTAPDWMIAQAARALEAVGRPTLYARVDGIARDGGFIVMELELSEPNLYFEFAPDAAARLAAAVAREMRKAAARR